MCFLFTLQADVGSYGIYLKSGGSISLPLKLQHLLCSQCLQAETTMLWVSIYSFFANTAQVFTFHHTDFFWLCYIEFQTCALLYVIFPCQICFFQFYQTLELSQVIVQSISYGRLLPNSLDNNLSTTINSNELSTDPWRMPFLILNLLPTVLLILTASARFY